ncbi:hypothetical protein PF008_g9348 [Phytophthora fragariae]|uniref:Integrase catalytic domain-containing protein n=1 Tax=Phytophthora fragariae TaxID=53985 RepID=A0A6G0RX23_9STRA|nr:hypothetical protein PF008_g9348 [Phytophthora fragariae]
MSFWYVIEHVPGEQNVWGDLLSRWGAGSTASSEQAAVRVTRLAVIERVSPLEDPEFVWPTENEIRTLQELARSADPNDEHDATAYDADRRLVVRADGQVWIPSTAVEMQQRLCVVAHAGASGHRGAQTTTTALSNLFYWRTMAADVSAFVAGCLHCMVTANGRVPRPYGETLVATKPNEVLHFDFLTMIEGERGLKYVLVLKDGMSGFVELVACVSATSDQAYQSLLDWFKRFGVVHQWISDQGAHFKNQVMEKLSVALGANHHFTTAYTPWANGTVEVVNREVLKSVKALLSERRLQVQDWPRVLPVVQAALNTMPADRLGGVTPLTAFTALPGGSQLRGILHPRDPLVSTVTWVEDETIQHLASVRAALDGMHREMTNASEKRRRAARDRHAKKRGVTLPRFSEGDFVLAATATGRSGNKLALLWRGPKRIVKAVNDYTFEVQDLMAPFDIELRHASRLQLYRDAARGHAEELVEQAIHGQGGQLIEGLKACRLSPETHRWEVQVKWFGLDDIEQSWEPAETIRSDVPVLFQQFVEERPTDPSRVKMAAALLTPGHGQNASAAPRIPRTRRRPRSSTASS